MRIYYSHTFVKLYQKLPERIKDLSEEKESVFKINPFDNRLKTHKLSGKLDGYWAFWINYNYRIIFSFINKNTIKFHSVGNHSIYR